MSRIVIGKADGKDVPLNLDVLLRTRLLIQANSGKGKSWLLRRLAEQLFGKAQVIIIDPEGEFASLREKFGYVLVGKGGETPADPRSAALVAHKLLELRAPAVCDLYEMKPSGRHEWVQRFFEAMIDAPKNLWHPCIVMLDEAHVFCPEKGAGESLASESVIGMATRGRKRGFCLVAATQRLGKFRKDAAAEMLNVMIGGTFIDIDRKRAADALGVYGASQHLFFDEIKLLDRGSFYALGPAISDERILVKVGPVETSHPEAGSSKHAAQAPPAPEQIAKLLPKLADLPKAAEEKAKTEAELRTEIRSLKAQLRSGPLEKVRPPDADPRVIERAMRQVQTQRQAERRESVIALKQLLREVGRIQVITVDVEKTLREAIEDLSKVSGVEIQKGEVVSHSPLSSARGATATEGHPRPDVIAQATNNGEISRSRLRILRAIAEFEAIGRVQISKSWIAARAGVSYTSSTYGNNLGYLNSNGYVIYPGPGLAALTDKGRGAAGEIEPPATSEEMLDSCMKLLSRSQQAILKALYEMHPEPLDKADLAGIVRASASSSTYGNNLGRLRSAGMIDYPASGKAKCADWLFLDQ